MNFQAYLEDTYRIIKKEPVLLVLGGLLIQLLNSVTLSLLYGPLFGGYMLMVLLLLRDKKKPMFNDLFNGFQLFRLLFPYFFVLLAKIIGFMLFVVPGLLFATWWIYVLPLMVDRRIGFSEAMRISSDKVSETGFFIHMVFILLVYVIPVILLNMLVSLMPFLMVLTILLMPFQVCCMASLYIDQFGPMAPADLQKEVKETAAATAEMPTRQIIEDAAEQTTEGNGDKPADDESPESAGSGAEKETPYKENGEEKQEKN